MFVRLLRNTPRQAARYARQQQNRLAARGATVVANQRRFQSTAASVQVRGDSEMLINFSKSFNRIFHPEKAIFRSRGEGWHRNCAHGPAELASQHDQRRHAGRVRRRLGPDRERLKHPRCRSNLKEALLLCCRS